MLNNGTWWKAPILAFCLSGTVYFGRGLLQFDRMNTKLEAHERKIAVMEQVLEKQELRDYILIQLAEKAGIPIPKEMK